MRSMRQSRGGSPDGELYSDDAIIKSHGTCLDLDEGSIILNGLSDHQLIKLLIYHII